MEDFEAPSFSLGLDCDLFDSEPRITSFPQHRCPSSSNELSIAAATLQDNDDVFETIIVDDSEPEYPETHPKLKRLRRGPTVDATSSSRLRRGPTVDATSSSLSVKPKVELLTGKRKQYVLDAQEPASPRFNNLVFRKLNVSPLRRFQLIDSDSDDLSISYTANNRKCNGSESHLHRGQSDCSQHLGLHKKRKEVHSVHLSTRENALEDFRSEKSFSIPTPAIDEVYEEIRRPMKLKSNAIKTNYNSFISKRSCSNLDDSLPPAYHYFFHDDPRIQELVRNRLPYFSQLGNVSITDLEQPSTSNIDYMGQFCCAESSIKDKKSSTRGKITRKSNTEDTSQGWVNPKLCVDKVTTKQAVKGKVHTARQTAGHWLTSPDGNKVYVGKNRQELTGRTAYIQYKKENGGLLKKAKRKSSMKKKKKKN